MEEQRLQQLGCLLQEFINDEVDEAVDKEPISVDFNKKNKHGFHFMRTYRVEVEGPPRSYTHDIYNCFDLSKSLYNIIDIDDFNNTDDDYFVVLKLDKDKLKSICQMKQDIEKRTSKQCAIDAEMRRHREELKKLENQNEN